MQANSKHQKIFPLHLPYEPGKCRKERKKLQKIEYLKKEKSFSSEIKENIFYSF